MIIGLRGLTLVAKFALTLFIARFIGLDALGKYGLVVGLAAVIPAITSLGLINTLSRNAVTQTLGEVTGLVYRYSRVQIAIYGAALVAVLASALVWDHWPFAVVVLAIVFFEQINDDLFMVLTHLRHPRIANILIFIRAAAWICLFIPLAFAFPSLQTLSVIWAFWLGGGVVALVCFAYATRHWPWWWPTFRPDGDRWLIRTLRQSWVLYSINIANIVGQYVDRFIVSLIMGLEYTGAYVLFWSIGNALCNLVITGVIQVAEPHLIIAHRERSASYWRLFRRLMAEAVGGAFVLAIVAGAFVYVALPYLDRPLATEFLPVLWLILGGVLLRVAYEVQGVVFYSRHQDRLTLATGLLIVAVTVTLNPILLPWLSLYGAAFSLIAAYGVGLIARRRLIAKPA